MKVVIVSKTHMSNAACVGGLTPSGRSLRLLNENGFNHPKDTDYNIRQVWNLGFTERRELHNPHVEDVLVTSRSFVGDLRNDMTMLDLVQRAGMNIWNGRPDNLFEGLLCWTNGGSGYISQEGEIPEQSVGFWQPDEDLTLRTAFNKIRYDYHSVDGRRSLPYTGFEEPVDTIPAGTLVRVSLARWWDRDGETEPRCSLQLSGWYDLPQSHDQSSVEDDLPF